jgi:hypothetical protein
MSSVELLFLAECFIHVTIACFQECRENANTRAILISHLEPILKGSHDTFQGYTLGNWLHVLVLCASSQD